jgi:hypothetical protein
MANFEENIQNVLKCKSCEKEITLETAIPCEWCDREIEEELGYTLGLRPDDKEPPLFCKKCTDLCDACEIRGCKECVEFVCCDCGYDMCIECRDNEVDCGCYGHCYSCGDDIDRGGDGWPCGECEKWYCRYCRRGDNPCKECGPEPDEDEEESNEDEEDTKSVEEEK